MWYEPLYNKLFLRNFLDSLASYQIFLSYTNNLHTWYQVFIFNKNHLDTIRQFQVFLSNTYNYMVTRNYFCLIIIICLHTVKWFQVTNNNNNTDRAISRMFANSPGDWGSILGRFIQKTQKMVLDTTLLNIQHYKLQIKGKVEQSV